MAVLPVDEAKRLVLGVGEVFGQSFSVKIYRDANEYQNLMGSAPPSYGWFSQRIMRVLLSTAGMRLPGPTVEFPLEAIVSITAHEVGHLVIGPKNVLAGYAAMKLLDRRKGVRWDDPRMLGGAINNIVTDLAINRHMGFNERLARRFGQGTFEKGRFIVFGAGGWARVEPAVKAGSIASFAHAPPYDPAEAFQKFSTLNMLRNQNSAAYQRARATLTPGERAADDLIEKMAVQAPSLGTQEMYDLMVDAMHAYLVLLRPPFGGGGLEELLKMLQGALSKGA